MQQAPANDLGCRFCNKPECPTPPGIEVCSGEGLRTFMVCCTAVQSYRAQVLGTRNQAVVCGALQHDDS